jgi:glutamate-ammonia-ligase adenylyltransferase
MDRLIIERMQISVLVGILDEPHLAAEYLRAWGVKDIPRAAQTLHDLAETSLTLDLLANVCQQLDEHLPQVADADATLDAFRQYMLGVRSPLSLAALLEREPTAMGVLLTALSLGPRWVQLLIDDPDTLDLLLPAPGGSGTEALAAELLAELQSLNDERAIVAALARFRGRNLLRIAQRETTGNVSLDDTFRELSSLADALVEGAFTAATRRMTELRPLPPRVDTHRLRRGIIATGALGGSEPCYVVSLELLIVYDAAGTETTALHAIHDHFDRMTRLAARWLDEAADGDVLTKTRLLSLPDSSLPAAATHAADDVVIGLDSFGRTWHRQEMLKARPIAGDQELCESVLSRLEPWLFRRYLSRADETGIKAFKRRILVEGTIHQDDWRDVRLARGGLNNLEDTIEFLQLLVGGDEVEARQRGSLVSLAGLERAGAISGTERSTLEDSYRFLRRLEHRLQTRIAPQATVLPDDGLLLTAIARDMLPGSDGEGLVAELRRRLDNSWQTLRKLLTAAFEEDLPVSREVELLLAPAPPIDEIRAALAPFGFEQPERALQALNNLASEQVPFLSTRRCRHLLGQILPRLLCAVAATPNPDETLDSLAGVSDSLGGKGVLWDVFRFNPPTLDLYVRLCTAGPYLSNILTTNPGMIDELIDSLQLDKLPSRSHLEATLDEMCRGGDDALPVLHDFKNAEHLRIGVRDILGKEDIDLTHAALADVADTCLAHVAQLEYNKLVEKFGEPTIGAGPREGQPARPIVLALGKLGGREPNYHSPLEVVFLYEADGLTRPTGRSRRQELTANNHFFTQFAQRVIKQLGELTPKGRLYQVEALLRPIGTIGALSLAISELNAHFSSGTAPLWHWQAICQTRPVFGDIDASQAVQRGIHNLLIQRPRRGDEPSRLRSRRKELEGGASPHNIKRGAGGTLDIEFIVQMLQLQHAAAKPQVLIANTQSALVALGEAGILDRQVAETLGQSYRFLRRVESGLRLLETTARHDLPADDMQLRRLALLLGHGNADRLRQQCLDYMRLNREQFDRLVQ